MRVFVFLASGILEDGSVAFFSYEFISFFGTELFFQCCKTVLWHFYHMNL